MKKTLAYLSVLALLLAVGFGLMRHDVMRVNDVNGVTLLVEPLPAGSEFGIRFIHSVAKSPVVDWFTPRDGQVALTRTVYQDFGAGLPHEAGPGQTMVFRDGLVEISGYTLRLERLDVRVGRVANHQLLLPAGGEHRSVPLNTLARPGASLSFTVNKEFEIEVLWRRWMRVLRG